MWDEVGQLALGWSWMTWFPGGGRHGSMGFGSLGTAPSLSNCAKLHWWGWPPLCVCEHNLLAWRCSEEMLRGSGQVEGWCGLGLKTTIIWWC